MRNPWLLKSIATRIEMSGIHSESTQFPPTATTDTGMREFRMIHQAF
jgi:hypothetical protein